MDRDRLFLIMKVLIMGLLPLMACIFTCLCQGGSLFDVSILSSEWNDEILYYKQVESVLSHGFPQGFFGYNESHAKVLSFASWSPVLYLPWTLFGLVFGWSLASPVIANLLFLSAALILYTLLVKPRWDQMIFLILGFAFYRSLTRYAMSATPEIICHAIVIIFCALAITYQKDEKKGKVILMFVLSMFATLMRPYLILFMLLPAWFCARKYKWKGCVLSAGLFGISLLLYALIGKYLQAAYLSPLFSTEFLHAGVGDIFRTLFAKTGEFFRQTFEFRHNGLARGAAYIAYGVTFLILVVQCASDIVKLRGYAKSEEGENASQLKRELPLRIFLVFSYLAMFAALILMYPYEQGSRHVLLFVTAGAFAIQTFQDKWYVKRGIVILCFLLIFFVRASDPYEYGIPFKDGTEQAKLSYWQEAFEGGVVLESQNVPCYDNTMIWLFNDQVEGKTVAGDWHALYALPKGMGISLVTSDFAKEHFDELQSRYLLVPQGGTIDEACDAAGFRVIGEHEGAIVYARY